MASPTPSSFPRAPPPPAPLVSLFVHPPTDDNGDMTVSTLTVSPPVPPPKPPHLRLLAFPRLSVRESAVHTRHASRPAREASGSGSAPPTPRADVANVGGHEVGQEQGWKGEESGIEAGQGHGANRSWVEEGEQVADEEEVGEIREVGLPGFDFGHNASGAWNAAGKGWDVGTVRTVVRGDSPSGPRGARTLYAFTGEGDNELSFAANTSLLIHNASVGDGWALASIPSTGDVGLLPSAYFVYTAGLAVSPSIQGSRGSRGSMTRSDDSLGQTGVSPSPSPAGSGFTEPVPQGTGGLERLRRSVMGERTMNRFSAYVTSGAEDWILGGDPSPKPSTHPAHTAVSEDNDSPFRTDHQRLWSTTSAGPVPHPDAGRFLVASGPSWAVRTPKFEVFVHSPERRGSMGGISEFVVYHVTSMFEREDGTITPRRQPSDTSTTPTYLDLHPYSDSDADADTDPSSSGVKITVTRRFSHFHLLARTLSELFPPLAIPPLPEKQVAGRLGDEFVAGRRAELERWIGWVVGHPVLRCTEVVMSFLSASDDEWVWPPASPSTTITSSTGTTSTPFSSTLIAPSSSSSSSPFYAHVYHPEFNVDFEDASLALLYFERHLTSLDRLLRPLRLAASHHRDVVRDMSDSHRGFSYALLSVLSGRSLGIPADRVPGEGPVERVPGVTRQGWEVGRKSGAVNKLGSWCWRDECDGVCAGATRAMRDAADALQLVADEEDAHARKTLMEVENGLKDLAHPLALYSGVIETGRATLARYGESIVASETAHSGVHGGSLALSSSSSRPSLSPSSSSASSSSPSTHSPNSPLSKSSTPASASTSGVGVSADADDALSSRCETVLNVTLSEIDHFHTVKTPTLVRVVRSYLDSEISRHEAALDRLRAAREGLDVVHTTQRLGSYLTSRVSGGGSHDGVPTSSTDQGQWVSTKIQSQETSMGRGIEGVGNNIRKVGGTGNPTNGRIPTLRCWGSMYEGELARPHQAAPIPRGLGHPWDTRARPVGTAASTFADGVAAIWEGVGGSKLGLW